MKIIHCESGLGNQMCYYAIYLAVKEIHPNEECMFETMLFDIPELDSIMKVWNGYELEEIFGIKVPDIKDVIDDKEYKSILNRIYSSNFWKCGWFSSKYYILSELNRLGLYNGFIPEKPKVINGWISDIIIKYRNTYLMYKIRTAKNEMQGKYDQSNYDKISVFNKFDGDRFYSDLFGIIKPNSGLDNIKDKVMSAFTFPEFSDEKNMEFAEYIKTVNSVSLHIRKSDCFKYNADCFKYGYFKRAVSYIKENVSNPVFVVFSDSREWCRHNMDVFGLNPEADNIKFADWNNGEHSFRDMQLMSLCKHNISTNSTFGFWASYLNKNPNKITCAPKGSFATTNWF